MKIKGLSAAIGLIALSALILACLSYRNSQNADDGQKRAWNEIAGIESCTYNSSYTYGRMSVNDKKAMMAQCLQDFYQAGRLPN